MKGKIKCTRVRKDAVIPKYASPGAAGADLYLCSPELITIHPNQVALCYTGIAVEIPEGYAGLLYARSGLASKRGLSPANKVGVIDSDYRGEIVVAMRNDSNTSVQILEKGDRIAQLVIAPVTQFEYEECDELQSTERGEGGFGSTGR